VGNVTMSLKITPRWPLSSQ